MKFNGRASSPETGIEVDNTLSVAYSCVAGVAVLTALGICHYFASIEHDDAYIVARYAGNLIDHGSLVFNLGERICAFTSPLDVMVQSAIYAIAGRDRAMSGHQLVGVVWLVLSISLLLWTVRSAHARALVLVLCLISPYALHWTFGGLETLLLFFLVTILSVASMKVRQYPTVIYLVFFVAGLAFITRYDSILFTLPICLHSILVSPRRRLVLPAMALGSFAALAWLAWAAWFYGDILPTSFHVKTPNFHASVLRTNLIYMAEYLVLSGVLPAFALVAWKAWQLGRWTVRTGRGHRLWQFRFRCLPLEVRDLWGIALGIALELAYGFTAATTHMMFSFRLLIPYLPAAVVLLCAVDAQIGVGKRLRAQRTDWAIAIFCLAMIGVQAAQAATIYRSSLNGLSTVGEWRNAGIRDVVERVNGPLERIVGDIRRHAATVSHLDQPRIASACEGIIAYRLAGAQIYGSLTAYRRQVPFDLMACDYLLAWRSPTNTLLSGCSDAAGLELLTSYDTLVSGSDARMMLYFNPHPHPFRLPDTVNGPP